MRLRDDSGDVEQFPRATHRVTAFARDGQAFEEPRDVPAWQDDAEEQLRASSVWPAVPPPGHDFAPADFAAPAPGASGMRVRRTSQARRLRAGDTALVTTTTQLIALGTRIPTLREAPLAADPTGLPARLDERETVIIAATLPPASSTGYRIGAPPRHSHPRAHAIRLAVASCTAVACVLAAIHLAAPLARNAPQPTSYTSQVPTMSGGQLAAPTGPWSTGSGVADTMGLGGGAAPGVTAPGSAGASAAQPQPPPTHSATPTHTPTPKPASNQSSGISPAPLHPWPPSNPFMYVPGHPAFGMKDVNGFYYWAFGQCTWWAQYKKQNERLTYMGSARYWAAGAAARGYRTGSAPAAGSTVVFQPGVQGASWYGHVAHVEAVYPGGWFLMSEMNFYVNGGGWGRVDYRYAHAGSGVTFIY